MNRPLKAGALCVSVFAIAAACFAQAPTQSQNSANADTQQQMQQRGERNVKRDQKEYFNSLDQNQKGYLTIDDVSADAYLSQNFPKCDTDHDGKLTWEELKICTQNNPPAK